MRQHEERVCVEVRRLVAFTTAHQQVLHDDDGDLVGQHVAECPTAEPAQLAHGGVSEVGTEGQRNLGTPQRWQQRECHDRDADGGAEPEREAQRRVGEHVAQLGRLVVSDAGNQQQRADDDHVGERRGPRGHEEAVACLQFGGGERVEAVEEDLHEEERGEGCPDFQVQVVVDIARDPRGIETEHEWRGRDRDHRERGQHDDGDGPHCDLALLVALVVQARDQRYQRGREHATQRQFVDEVGAGVGLVVGSRPGSRDIAVPDATATFDFSRLLTARWRADPCC